MSQARNETIVAVLIAASIGISILWSIYSKPTVAPPAASVAAAQPGNKKKKATGTDASTDTVKKALNPERKKSSEPAIPTTPSSSNNNKNVASENDSLNKAELSQTESALGTKEFKTGSFRLSIDHFSRAIDLCPEEDRGSKKVLLNNRAAAREKLLEWKETEADAALALELDPSYRRAIQRRAKARENLGKFTEALEDLVLWKTLDTTDANQEERTLTFQSIDRVARILAKTEAEKIWKVRSNISKPFKLPRLGACRQYYYGFSLDGRAMRAPPSLLVVNDAVNSLNENDIGYGEQLCKIACLYKARLELEEAMKYFEKALSVAKLSPVTQARCLSEIASLYYLSDDFKACKEKLLTAQKLHETSRSYILLAYLAVHNGDLAEARALLDKGKLCIENGPEAKNERADLYFYYSVIACLEEKPDLSLAREYLDTAISDAPDFGTAYMQLGVVLFRLNLVTEGLEVLDRACVMIPEIGEVHNFHGEVLMSLNKRDEASKKFADAMNADDQCVLPLLNRGVMYMSTEDGSLPVDEDLKSAISLFDQAVAIDPTCDIAFIHRASYYCIVGDLKMAMENYDKAIEITNAMTYLKEYLGFRAMCVADIAVQEKLKSSSN